MAVPPSMLALDVAVSAPALADAVEPEALSSEAVSFCSASTRLVDVAAAEPVDVAPPEDCSAVRNDSASCENWLDGLLAPGGGGPAAAPEPWTPPTALFCPVWSATFAVLAELLCIDASSACNAAMAEAFEFVETCTKVYPLSWRSTSSPSAAGNACPGPNDVERAIVEPRRAHCRQTLTRNLHDPGPKLALTAGV